MNRVNGLAKAAFGLLAIRALVPVALFLRASLGGGDGGSISAEEYEAIQSSAQTTDFLLGAFTFGAFIVFLVWQYRAFTSMKGHTKYGPGMSVGAWFIPLANFVLPGLVMADGWKTATKRSGGWLIPAWFVYVGYVFVDVFFRVATNPALGLDFMHDPDNFALLDVLSWLSLVLEIGAFALIAIFVRGVAIALASAEPDHVAATFG